MLRLLLIIALLTTLTACDSSSTESDPADTVLNYMLAKVDGDTDKLSSLLCAELESTLTRESESFSTVDAVLENATCQAEGYIVTCTGAIVADYGGEDTEFPLTSYRVVQEDGIWKWCGEAE